MNLYFELHTFIYKEQFDDTKWTIISRKQKKDRQCKCRKKSGNNNKIKQWPTNITYKIKD